MKLFAGAATLLLALTAPAQSSIFGSSSDISANVDDSLSVPGENPLHHCKDPANDVLSLERVDLDPNPPKPGQNLTVTARGILKADIEDGAKVHLQVKFGLITIIRQTTDLCDAVKNVNLECPLHKDNATELTKTVTLPREIPPGKYTVIADVDTKDADKITCLMATVEFHRGGSGAIVASEWKQGL